MAKAFTVLTAIGVDRVGIVDDLFGRRDLGRMQYRRKQDGGTGRRVRRHHARFGTPRFPGCAWPADCPALGGKLGLRIESRPTREPRAGDFGRPYLLEAVSLDTPGIVHSVTAILRGHGINIEELSTDTAAAPWTGAPMFRLKAHLIIGPSVSISRLKEELSLLQQEHDLDIALKPVFAANESA